jgi:hypothetical protein
MSDRPSWTRDHCTCGHTDIQHENGSGRCKACDTNAQWREGGSSMCTRYQWDGKERVRTW